MTTASSRGFLPLCLENMYRHNYGPCCPCPEACVGRYPGTKGRRCTVPRRNASKASKLSKNRWLV